MFRYFWVFFLAFVFSSQACFADAPPSYANKTDEITFAGGDVAFGAESQGKFGDMVKTISQTIHSNAISWATPLKDAATTLFLALMGISLVWTLIEIALRQGSIGEIFAELTKSFVFFGLFMCVVKNADDIAGIIYNSFMALGDQPRLGTHASWSKNAASIAGNTLDVGMKYIVTAGLWLAAIYKNLGWTDVIDAVMGIPYAILTLCIGFFIFLVCALMCVKVLVAEATLWIIMYGGIFILGFGASKWTKDIAISYLKTVMAMCFAYFGMLLVANIMIDEMTKSINEFQANIAAMNKNTAPADMNWYMLIPELALALILYFIMDKIPTIFSSMINGMNFTAGPASFAAAGAAMSMGASRLMMGKKVGEHQAGFTAAVRNGVTATAKGALDAIKKLGKKGGENEQASETQAKDGETAAQEKSEPPTPAKMKQADAGTKQADAGSEAESQAKAQTDASSQSNKSDVINLTKEDYTVTNSAADGQKPAGSSEGSASSEQAQSQPQTGYFEQLEKEIASNAEKKAQESSSQNDLKQTFTAQDANRYKSFYAAKKDFPQLERSEWSKATKDSYKNFTAKDASRYEDIYAARKDYPHLDLAAWQNAKIKSTLDKAADAAKKKDN